MESGSSRPNPKLSIRHSIELKFGSILMKPRLKRWRLSGTTLSLSSSNTKSIIWSHPSNPTNKRVKNDILLYIFLSFIFPSYHIPSIEEYTFMIPNHCPPKPKHLKIHLTLNNSKVTSNPLSHPNQLIPAKPTHTTNHKPYYKPLFICGSGCDEAIR